MQVNYEKDIVYIRARIKDLSSLSLNSFGESFNKNLFLLSSSSWEKALQNIKSYLNIDTVVTDVQIKSSTRNSASCKQQPGSQGTH